MKEEQVHEELARLRDDVDLIAAEVAKQTSTQETGIEEIYRALLTEVAKLVRRFERLEALVAERIASDADEAIRELLYG